MANFATKSVVSLFLFLFVIVGADDSTCQWKFYSCRNVGEVWRMSCEVELMKLDENGRICGDSKRKSFVSWRTQRYRDFCTVVPECSINPVWCSWGPWETTYSDCDLRRTRRKCCHPTTFKRSIRISCGSYDEPERKRIPGCEEERKDEVMDTRQFKIFIRDCILITISCIFVLVTCTVGCRLYCRFRGTGTRSSTPQDRLYTQRVASPHTQVQRPLMPSAVYHHGGDSRVIISSPKLQPDTSSPPPSYEEAVKVSA